jgi:hypothetical protein
MNYTNFLKNKTLNIIVISKKLNKKNYKNEY